MLVKYTGVFLGERKYLEIALKYTIGRKKERWKDGEVKFGRLSIGYKGRVCVCVCVCKACNMKCTIFLNVWFIVFFYVYMYFFNYSMNLLYL